MDTSSIRTKLHQFIDELDDEKTKAIYTLFENEIEQHSLPYSDAFKEELNKRVVNYYDTGKTISPKEMHERLMALKNKRA